MADYSKLKEEIRRRIAERMHVETPREKEIRENNSGEWGMKLMARSRHALRHKKAKRPTLQEYRKYVNLYSKDS